MSGAGLPSYPFGGLFGAGSIFGGGSIFDLPSHPPGGLFGAVQQNQPLDGLKEHLAKLLREGTHGDVVLVAVPEDGPTKEIRADSGILGRSEYFRRLFSEGFAEGSSRRASLPVKSVRLLEELIHFLYTDSFTFGVDAEGASWTVEETFDLLLLLDRMEAPSQATKQALLWLEQRLKTFSADPLVILLRLAIFIGVRAQIVLKILRSYLMRPELCFRPGELIRMIAFIIEVQSAEPHCPIVAVDCKFLRWRCLTKVEADPKKLLEEFEEAKKEATSTNIVAATAMVLSQAMQGASNFLCGINHSAKKANFAHTADDFLMDVEAFAADHAAHLRQLRKRPNQSSCLTSGSGPKVRHEPHTAVEESKVVEQDLDDGLHKKPRFG